MNILIKPIIIVFFLTSSVSVFSQYAFLMDSVELDLGENRSIQIVAENFHDIEHIGNLDSIFDLSFNFIY